MAIFDAYPHVFAGAQRIDTLLASELIERGWSVTVLLPADGVFRDQLSSRGIPSVVIPAPAQLMIYGRQTRRARAVRAVAALPRYWQAVAAELRRCADIAHVVDHRGLLLAGPAARLARVPIVWHIHAISTSRPLNALGALLTDRTVVPSGVLAQRMPDLRHPVVVANALPADAFQVAARRDAPSIVTLARLHPDKGLEVLLKALSIVAARRADARAVIAGAPQSGYEGYARQLVALRDELGLRDIVDLTGHDRPAGELLGRSAVYVQSSHERTEIQPLAILEAMAAGAAVVSTDVGGIGELLGRDERGWLVPPGNPAALAAAILEALEPELSEGRATAARRFVHDRFRPDRLADDVTHLYEQL